MFWPRLFLAVWTLRKGARKVPTKLELTILAREKFFPSELGSKDLNDYKNCKAYSYFKSGWLEQLWYHCIDSDSLFCVIKAQCRKSQNIRDTCHKLWLVIEKKSAHIRSCHHVPA